ncbi:MAG: hypothetical protein AB1611_00280 [bacterium]
MNKFLAAQGTKFLGFAAFTFILLIISSTSFAHKVNIFAYVEGNQVYTESYFPDGRKVEGGTIEIYDSQENKLLTGTTDREGKFNFVPPKKDNLKIVLIATMGHKNSYLLSAEELSGITGTAASTEGAAGGSGTVQGGQGTSEVAAPQESGQPASAEVSTGPASGQVDVQEIKKIIDQSLDQKLAPIIRELARAQQEKVSPTQIFGGIGYIFGLVGLILFFTKKKA